MSDELFFSGLVGKSTATSHPGFVDVLVRWRVVSGCFEARNRPARARRRVCSMAWGVGRCATVGLGGVTRAFRPAIFAECRLARGRRAGSRVSLGPTLRWTRTCFWRLLKAGLELRVMRRQLSNLTPPLCPDSIFYELQETLLGCQCSTQQAFGHQTTAVVLDRSAVRSSELGALRDDDWMKS